jgi:ketosteroid isomerase-like protein
MSTQSVIEHHLGAIGNWNLSEILSDYSEDSVLLTQDGALRGLTAIRGMLENLHAIVASPGFTFELKHQTTEGEVGYVVWRAESDTVDIPLGTDTFIVRDGKIVTQTFSAEIKTKN